MDEERLNLMRGYKATLRKANVSDEDMEHAQSSLDELGGNQPLQELDSAHGDPDKEPIRKTAGLKAAMYTPGVTEEGMERAKEQLRREAPQE